MACKIYKRPFCDIAGFVDDSFSDLKILFEKEHGSKIKEFHWTTTLILFALPFAKDFVTIVHPEDYQINPFVLRKAKKSRIKICTSSLSSFPPELLERMVINHMAPTTENDPICLFSDSIKKAMGESETKFRDLVPNAILNFGKDHF